MTPDPYPGFTADMDRATATSRALDEMLAAANRFDGSYEAARDRFAEACNINCEPVLAAAE